MDIKGNRILITGGMGFIGSWLVENLIDQNEIVIYDIGHRNALKYLNLENNPNISIIMGNILDLGSLKKSAKDCNLIIHLAAIAGIDTVIKKPSTTMKVNLLGTYNILEVALDLDIDRYIDFSTSEVYGPYVYKGDEDTMTSQGKVGIPRWTYAVSKLAAEHLSHSYHHDYGLPVTSIRPFNIYGPRQVGEGAIHKFILAAINNKDLLVYGDGNQIRAWCYVSDIVEAIFLVLKNKEAIGESFNIGNPQGTITILGLAEKIIELSRSKSKIAFKKRDYVDVEVRVPDITKAEKLLGYHPKIGITEGLLKTIEWYKREGML